MTARILLTCVVMLCTYFLAAQKKFPLLKVSEVGTNSPDTFRLQGVVREIYQCPPCPPGAQCKPCIGNHIQISDSADRQHYVRLFTNTPTQFVITRGYIFTIWLSNRSHPADFLQLVSVEEIKKEKETNKKALQRGLPD